MMEIGGYFGLEQLPGRPLYGEYTDFNCARSALLYVMRTRGYRKLFLPYFLCGCVSGMCERFGIPYAFYHIGEDFLPEDIQPEADDAVYLVNYYGRLREKTIRAVQKQYGNLILDNVQAYFALPVAGVDTIYSCRKFFGVPDGAFLASDLPRDEWRKLPRESAVEWLQHLAGRLEVSANTYYAAFKKRDDAFEEAEMCRMSLTAENLLGAIDYESVRRKREQNYAFLAQRLGDKNRLTTECVPGPYCYPFLLPEAADGAGIRRALAKDGIYVPTLWPDLPAESSASEHCLAANLLPLPCDQRYGEQEMTILMQKLEALL